MIDETMFVFVKGMIKGLCSKYEVEDYDLELLLENYEKIRKEN